MLTRREILERRDEIFKRLDAIPFGESHERTKLMLELDYLEDEMKQLISEENAY